MTVTVRIAMWSGPRNISTAMMRSFDNRSDSVVSDEPLYAYYLNATGIEHPMRDEVIASQSTDWETVTRWLSGPIPNGRPVWYQKHMTHHLLDEVGRDWLDRVQSCFLLRDPRAVLASYARKRESVTTADVGILQQAAIFDEVAERSGMIPPVLDAADVLRDPRTMLTRLCQSVGIAFDERMLSWPAGPRESDGVWGRHWYESVRESTGFQPDQPPPDELPADLEAIAEACRPAYERMRQYALRPVVT
ncbi:MAG: hypothetical protein U5K33_10800 [Halofilum sp. (in: g-proteobacteria)]|nr:hypothetical protein [Halofilum sp. (in: g-proteobacteria)]